MIRKLINFIKNLKNNLHYNVFYDIINIVDGGLAQLGERLPYKQRVGGSSPSASTIK